VFFKGCRQKSDERDPVVALFPRLGRNPNVDRNSPWAGGCRACPPLDGNSARRGSADIVSSGEPPRIEDSRNARTPSPMNAPNEARVLMTAMRCVAVAALCAIAIRGARGSEGFGRPTMVGPPPAEEAARSLMDAVASSCNHRQFIAFMNHFTAKRASAIRGRMEKLFIQNDMEMEIRDVIVLSHSEDRIVCGVRYAWSPKAGPKQLIASKVTAVKVADSWKVDGEQVQDRKEELVAAQSAAPTARFDFGGAGVVVLNPGDDFLPLDIPRRPGGCANGRCAVR